MTGANSADSESPEAGEPDKWRGVCVCVCVCVGNCTLEAGRERGDQFWELLVVWNCKTQG